MRIGLSAVVIVLAAFPPAPATKDLISNNGQYKQQERTILISPPHAMPFPPLAVSLSLSLSQQGATDKVGKWSLDSAERRGRGKELKQVAIKTRDLVLKHNNARLKR